jgi:hypothetical protein
MAFQDYFDLAPAYNPDTQQLVADATFQVFATDDLAYTTPLGVFAAESGVALVPLSSNSIGMLPAFRVAGSPTQVILKSGSFTTLLTSRYAAVIEAGLDPETVAAALQAGETASTAAAAAEEARVAAVLAKNAAQAVPTTTDAVVASVISTPGSGTRVVLDATIDDVVQEALVEFLDGLEPEPGTAFNFTTRASDGCLVLVVSPAPPPAVPDAPADLEAVAGIGAVELSWSPSTAPELGPIDDYRVQYKAIASPTWINAPRTPSTATEQTISGITNGVAHHARVAGVNVSGVGAYSEPVEFLPGVVDGIVFQDSGARVAAELSGSMPDLGPEAWAGTVGNFEVDGTHIKGKSGAPGSLQSVGVGARGKVKLTCVLNVDTLAAAGNISTRIYVKYVDSQNYAFLQIGVSAAGACSFTFTAVVANVAISNTFGMPAGAIPGTSAAADRSISIEQTSATTYVVIINGTTRTVTLASDPGAAHAQSTHIGLTGNSPRFKYKNLVVEVEGTYV